CLAGVRRREGIFQEIAELSSKVTMSSTTVQIPNFKFASFYYGQILEALTLYKRQFAPELTDESEFEPAMQLLRAFALVGHLNNVLSDIIANETTLPTAQL